MNKNINNVRGFTLIELLAVIVVLAIVMLMAVNAVIPRMNEARVKVFALEANSMIEAAQTYFTNNSFGGTDTTNALPVEEGKSKCVTVATLRTSGYSDSEDTYKGYVTVTYKGGLYLYKITLTNGQLMVKDQGSTEAINKDVASGDVKTSDGSVKDECPSGS